MSAARTGMPAEAPSRAWHVTRPWQTCVETLETRFGARGCVYRRRDGTSPSLPRAGRLLPRRDEGQQRHADLPGRRRPEGIPPDSATGQTPLSLAPSRPLPAWQPLPPPRRDPAGKPLRRHARPERPIRPGLQRAAPPQAPCLRPTVLVASHRVGGAVRLHGRLHPQQPGTPRFRPKTRGLALDVGARPRWDRFAWCRTTPTS
jgi:hypothetical protein